jgi:hypothetical protein
VNPPPQNHAPSSPHQASCPAGSSPVAPGPISMPNAAVCPSSFSPAYLSMQSHQEGVKLNLQGTAANTHSCLEDLTQALLGQGGEGSVHLPPPRSDYGVKWSIWATGRGPGGLDLTLGFKWRGSNTLQNLREGGKSIPGSASKVAGPWAPIQCRSPTPTTHHRILSQGCPDTSDLRGPQAAVPFMPADTLDTWKVSACFL